MQRLNIKNELFYGGLSRDEFELIKDDVRERNYKNLLIWLAASSVLWGVNILVYNKPPENVTQPVFAVTLLANFVIFIYAIFLYKPFPILFYPVIYFYELYTLGVGVALSLVQPNVRVATLVALAPIVSFFFIERTIITAAIISIIYVSYIVLGRIYINPEIYKWGKQTLHLFMLGSLAMAHSINKSRFKMYLYSLSLKKVADIQANYNEELKKEVAAKTQRIVDLHDKFIVGMATMVESRDNSTGGHIRRTSEVVRFLIEEILKDNTLNLSEDFCQNLIKAAPLHDLGKIAVDDEILRKPGRFTPEEYQQMKFHAEEGARVVHEVLIDSDDKEYSRIAENVAHYHHERIDGSGYPKGLKGDEIPIEARIMAIADVYDALVSKRVYKDEYSFEKANQIILEGMGSQFDSRLEKYYLAARPKLEAYYS